MTPAAAPCLVRVCGPAITQGQLLADVRGQLQGDALLELLGGKQCDLVAEVAKSDSARAPGSVQAVGKPDGAHGFIHGGQQEQQNGEQDTAQRRNHQQNEPVPPDTSAMIALENGEGTFALRLLRRARIVVEVGDHRKRTWHFRGGDASWQSSCVGRQDETPRREAEQIAAPW